MCAQSAGAGGETATSPPPAGARSGAGAVGEAFSERESGAVREAEAERVASRFRIARYYSRDRGQRAKIGSFPELAELRSRLDFNGFYDSTGIPIPIGEA